jgi:hypothetical protein
MRRLVTAALLAPLAFVAACSSPTGEDEWQRVIGTIAPMFSSQQLLFIPEGITAGRPFTITVTTVGSSTCTRVAGADVAVTGAFATVTPYDRVPRGGVGCTRDLRGFPRDVTLTLPTAGAAVIRIRGRGFDGGAEQTYEVAVTVRPRA